MKWLRKIYSQIKYPGFGTCAHCGRSWAVVKPHDLSIDEEQGFFVCCEHCWKKLSFCEKAIYVLELYCKWKSQYRTSPDMLEKMLEAINKDRKC